jgi:hypothetical protein
VSFRAYWETAVPAFDHPIGRCVAVVLTALVLGPVQPASAQGFFSSLFGGFQRREPPPRASSYADPAPEFGERRRPGGETSGSYGHGTAFCVRTCDGRYFPLQRQAGASPVEVCRSLCPAATTMVFNGSKIDGAVAQNGTRYADLDAAFAYRDKVVQNCTCNGKDGLGLARMETNSDPTLRPGDIVATTDGLATFHGKNRSAEFTPVNRSSGEWARKLSETKVRPAPPQAKVDIAAPADQDAKPKPRTRRADR